MTVVSSPITWDEYFMTMAFLVAMKSKDPSTKVGAVIVGPDNEIRSTGFNGLPRNYTDLGERLEKPLKYRIIHHAEENAILHCARVGIPTKSCKIYVSWIPCAGCAKMIVQAGITEVIYADRFTDIQGVDPVWCESMEISLIMLKEAGLTVRHYTGAIIKPHGFTAGKVVDLDLK